MKRNSTQIINYWTTRMRQYNYKDQFPIVQITKRKSPPPPVLSINYAPFPITIHPLSSQISNFVRKSGQHSNAATTGFAEDIHLSTGGKSDSLCLCWWWRTVNHDRAAGP